MFYFDRVKLWYYRTQISKKYDENLHLLRVSEASRLVTCRFYLVGGSDQPPAANIIKICRLFWFQSYGCPQT